MRGVVWVLLTVFCVSDTASSVSTQTCLSGGMNLQAESAPKYITSMNYPGNYPHNTDCQWTIQTLTANYVVKIVVEDSYLESSSCFFDYLVAYDGSGTLGTPLNKWCGTTKPTIHSSGSFLTLKFHSDSSFSGRGFNISYQEVPGNESSGLPRFCRSGGVNLLAESAPKEIVSVNYPWNYPPDTDCVWTIQTLTVNYVVKIVVNDSYLELSSACSKDYLVAYDGSGTLGTQLDKWCGTTMPSTIYSFSPFLTLKFHSDGFFSLRGFKLSYQEVPEAESLKSIQTCHYRGMTLRAQSAPKYITSPNYPQNYPGGTHCQWTIQTLTANYVVKIVVEDSDLESSFSCFTDYLVAYDASGTWGRQLTKWCGPTTPTTIYSSGPFLTLKFYSDSSYNERGFKLSYQEVPGRERVPERVSGLSTGAIIGIVVGVVAGLILLSIICCCCCCAQRNKRAATAGTAAAVTSRGGPATSAHVTMTTAGSQVFFITSTFSPNSGQMTTNQYAAAYASPAYPGPPQCSNPSASAPTPMGFSYPQSNAPAGYPAQVPTSTAKNVYYNRQESLPSEPPPPYWMASSAATAPAPGADTQQRAPDSAPPAAPRSGQAAPGGSDNRAFVPDEV